MQQSIRIVKIHQRTQIREKVEGTKNYTDKAMTDQNTMEIYLKVMTD